MTRQEFGRLEVLLRVESGRLRIADPCELIGLRRRQVFRLLCGLRQDGAASLVSKHRGKPSNHRLPIEVRILALLIVRERYAAFGPTPPAEKLAADHAGAARRSRLTNLRAAVAARPSHLPRSTIWRSIYVKLRSLHGNGRITEAERQRGFAALAAHARREPVTITTNEGRDQFVVLSAEEYARLKRRDRRVGLAEDLPAEWIEAVRNATVPDKFAALDAELK